MEKSQMQGYLFLHNISKKNNIGGIIRSACAFNLSKVFYVGSKDTSKKMKVIKDFTFFGNQGTLKKIQYHGFNSLKQAKEYFVQNKIFVCGVQIGQGSQPIQNHPFRGNTAFFLGNQGTGIIPVHKQICDHFVYIPQYTQKTASLNVSVAAGIIFHHFALWAKFEQSKIYGQKFKQYGNDEQQEDQAKLVITNQKIETEFQNMNEDIFKK